jgi:hypothetical protein
MRQNGHGIEYTVRYLDLVKDYARMPIKPVIDGEPVYEIAFKPGDFGHTVAADIRRAFHWDVFSGGFGHTYGHHSVWQMWKPKHAPVNGPLMPWKKALDQLGAAQMQHGKNLMLSRPFLTRIPDDSVIVPAEVKTSVPGAGSRRFVATRDSDGAYAMIYAPLGVPFSVRMDAIKGAKVKASWFNPRTGEATAIGEFENSGTRSFTPPDKGELLDWILVLDDASKSYPPPGKVMK